MAKSENIEGDECRSRKNYFLTDVEGGGGLHRLAVYRRLRIGMCGLFLLTNYSKRGDFLLNIDMADVL